MHKGYKHSEEAKFKISAKARMQPRSEKQMADLIEPHKSLIGKKRPHTEETKIKMSISAKIKPRSSAQLAHLRILSDSQRGKPLPDLHRKRISEAHKAKPITESKLKQVRQLGFSNRGKIHTEETRKKMSLAGIGKHSGERGSNWCGGLTAKNKAIRESYEYNQWRKAVFARDGYACTSCLSITKLQADHIKPFALYPELRFSLDNGRVLCVECHRKTDTWGGKTNRTKLVNTMPAVVAERPHAS